MKWRLTSLIAACLSLGLFPTAASMLYVDLNSTNSVSPYADWSTAATNIQDAIDAATTGDSVVVTDGVYSVGARFSDGATNRVYINKAITVQSVNGPWSTSIVGASNTRPAWVTNGTSLIGFTLTNGNAATGGGVWCSSSNAIVANCLIVSNSATGYGSGVYQGTCNNCFIGRNRVVVASPGAAVYRASLNNCTVSGNTALTTLRNSGVNACVLTNCILQNNTGGNYSSSQLSYCCATPAADGSGNFTNDPGFFVDGIHLTNGSPCIGAGTIVAAVGTDIFGNSWSNPPSVGCAEWQPSPYVPRPQPQYTNQPIGFSIGVPPISGIAPISVWWIKDGAPLQDDGHFNLTQTTNLVATGVAFSDSGSYQLVASNSFGIAISAVARVTIHAVDINSTNPVAPYASLATAATNIQDAIDAASVREIILVADGIYNTGGKVISGISNRVALDKPVTVTSVNGYAHTIIQGAWDPVSTNGPAAIRCAYLTTNAMLKGFKLENGATPSGGVGFDVSDSGGGAFCVSTNAVVSNCFLTNNSSIFGGGICHGTLNNSLVSGNLALCGGGACYTVLNNCTVVNNYCVRPNLGASVYGGGTYDCVMQNSIVLGNYDEWMGIAMGLDDYQNSTYPGDFGYPWAVYSYSCTHPLPSGPGNIDGYSTDPQFLDIFHIASTSPCHGAGGVLYASGTDLDGEPWSNPPSMGCDEVVASNLVGPLSVSISVSLMGGFTNLLVSAPGFPPPPHSGFFEGNIIGHAAYIAWSFGDGITTSNSSASISHYWTNSGDYIVTFTAYNNDNPDGVATNTVVHVIQPDTPLLQPAIMLTNGFQFQYIGQTNANYTIQYTTNLAPPVTWQTLETIYWNFNNVVQVNDPVGTNAARFYRVLVQ